MRYDLNGTWKFNYAIRPDCRPELFYQSRITPVKAGMTSKCLVTFSFKDMAKFNM